MFRLFPHFGIHVGDLARATRFYVEGLGFERMDRADRVEGLEDLLGLPDAVTHTQFVRHPGGMTVELWALESGRSTGDGQAKPSNERGLSHLCMVVDDLDAAAARIVDYGGTRLDATRTHNGYGRLMFCADPDGVRIEIVEVRQPA